MMQPRSTIVLPAPCSTPPGESHALNPPATSTRMLRQRLPAALRLDQQLERIFSGGRSRFGRCKSLDSQNNKSWQSGGLLICGPRGTKRTAHAGDPRLNLRHGLSEFGLRVVLKLPLADASNRNFQLLKSVAKSFAKKLAFGRVDHGVGCQNPGELWQRAP